MDIKLLVNRNLSAYLRVRFFSIVLPLKKNLLLFCKKVYQKIPTITFWLTLCSYGFWYNPDQINHNSCERAISLNKNYKYIHFPLTCHFLMRPVNWPFLASIFSTFLLHYPTSYGLVGNIKLLPTYAWQLMVFYLLYEHILFSAEPVAFFCFFACSYGQSG